MDVSFIINELGEDRKNYFNAMSPPIMQTSNFAFNSVDDLRNALLDEYNTYIYTRGRNPTVDILRKKLAALDGGEDCIVFNSGASAIFASVFSQVKAGDHIISVQKPYSWAQHLLDNILPRFNISTTYVDGRDIVNFEKAITKNTTVIYLESPNSWDFAISDLAAVAALAKRHNIITICDNSYCSPLYQKPLEMGIDLSLQTATKYICGHSDTLGGVLSGSAQLIQKIFRSELLNIGSGIQPFNAWLLLRGLRTLPLRLERVSHTTRKVLQYVKGHPAVEKVIYPFDDTFDQYELARRQMKDAFGLFTFLLKDHSLNTIETFCNNLQHIKKAVSWGGHESLIIPHCAGFSKADYNPGDPDHRMIRLYCGLEDQGYLLADLERGFNSIV